MRLVHVHLRAGRPPSEKRAALDAVQAAFLEAFRIPEPDRDPLVHEHAAEDFEARHGLDAVLVEATVFPERSLDAKRALFGVIARNLEGIGLERSRVLVVLRAPSLESPGFRGGKAATDVDLAFQVAV